MGIYTTFHLVYGFRLPADLKHKHTQEDFSPFTEELEPYLEGSEQADGFTLIWDQMGCGQETVFGESLCYMGAEEAAVKEVNVDPLRTERLNELFAHLFRDYDVPSGLEPRLLSIVSKG